MTVTKEIETCGSLTIYIESYVAKLHSLVHYFILEDILANFL